MKKINKVLLAILAADLIMPMSSIPAQAKKWHDKVDNAKYYPYTPLLNSRFESETIPYMIKADNSLVKKSFLGGARLWNNTGVVHFKLVKSSGNKPFVMAKELYKRFAPDSKASKNGYVALANTDYRSYYSKTYFNYRTDANYNMYYLSKQFYKDDYKDIAKYHPWASKARIKHLTKVDVNGYKKRMRTVLTHEMGHTLGLADVQNNQKLLMHYMDGKLQASKPTRKDIKGVKMRYKIPLNRKKYQGVTLDRAYDTGTMHVSWAKAYTTLKQVKDNTDNIVRVKVINNHSIKSRITGVDTIDKVKVKQVVKGSQKLIHKDINIHQMGVVGHALEGSKILTPGKEYVLALIKEAGFKDQYEPLQEGVSIFETTGNSDQLLRLYDHKTYSINDLR